MLRGRDILGSSIPMSRLGRSYGNTRLDTVSSARSAEKRLWLGVFQTMETYELREILVQDEPKDFSDLWHELLQ